MAYENIYFHLPNMAVKDGNFFLFDYTNGLLYQKTASGTIAFQYPTTIPGSFISYTVGNVICLQYDGYSFWTLQVFTDNSGILIRRWEINNFICVLKAQFPKINTSTNKYLADTFSVEYYNTNLSEDFLSGSTYIIIDEYTESIIFSGTVMGLYSLNYGTRETVTVASVVNNYIYLAAPLNGNFFKGDFVNISPSLFLFNNYYLLDSTKGSLMMLDPNTGADLSQRGDLEFLSIKSSKFCRLKGILANYNDVHTLAYVKGTNLKLRNMSDLYRYKATLRGTDTFSGIDYSLPASDKWQIQYGDPVIYNNSLYCAVDGNGNDVIKSIYTLAGDFEVQVSGTLAGYTTYTGVDYNVFNHYMEFTNSVATYKFGLSFSNRTEEVLFSEDFSAGGSNWTSLVGTTNYTLGYMNHTTDGATVISNNYVYLDTDIATIQFDFKNHGTGNSNDQYYASPLYIDGNNKLSVFMRTYASGDNYVVLSKMILGANTNLFTSYKYNYYNEAGNWFTVKINKNGNNINFRIWKTSTAEPGTWDWTGTWGNIPIYGKFHSNAFYTASSGTGLDNISIKSDWSSLKDKYLFGVQQTPYTGINNNYVVVSGVDYGTANLGYNLNVKRVSNTLSFKYRTITSGIDYSSWTNLTDVTVASDNLYVSLGLYGRLITISGAYFDDFTYASGYLTYPVGSNVNYGIMNIDNVKVDQSTIIPVYAIDIEKDNLYRLQNLAAFYGTNITWATYNFQISPIRPFVDFITVDASTHVLPATGRNTATIQSVTLDQYGQGIVNKPISFTDDDSIGFITTKTVYTDMFYNTGRADTGYTSGTAIRTVTIEGSATQMD